MYVAGFHEWRFCSHPWFRDFEKLFHMNRASRDALLMLCDKALSFLTNFHTLKQVLQLARVRGPFAQRLCLFL